ncbi:MAG: excinuclease ABC subunit UvrA [Lachnospiraceae bacterium]|nr:excinuclease ABC subunit UvrA [Lachnospiraceae bacterium]
MIQSYIKVKGARENNLKNLDVNIPRDKFVVLTGLSGSGKSSLAFDTIYAEGQRRYMESLSSYARQFLGMMEKPDVDSIEGLPPAISIDQKSTNRNPRSTVGTVTEIYDYFRLLFARIGVPHCPICGKEIRRRSIDEMVDEVTKLPEGTRIMILAPVVRGRKGEHTKVLSDARRSGYIRVIIDSHLYDLSEEIHLEKNNKHNISIVIDRLVVREGMNLRLTDSIENALKLTDGLVMIDKGDDSPLTLSRNFACPDCGTSIEELEPRTFSFNNPFGACPVCHGIGQTMEFSVDLILPDKTMSIIDKGAMAVGGWKSVWDNSSFSRQMLNSVAKEYGINLKKPFCELSPEHQNIIMYGTGNRSIRVKYESQRGSGEYATIFEGIIGNIKRRYRESTESAKAEYEEFMQVIPCSACGGKRLRPEALSVTVGGKNIDELSRMSISDLCTFMNDIKLTPMQEQIGALLLKEIRNRLGFLNNVGLDYLTLARATASLSGGEAQRIRLATQIGSGLVGVAYILDEPSIGLHQRDNSKLISALKDLKDLGNTLIVVEHDEDTMRAADHIIDIGPGAGSHGGKLVAQGTVEDICNCPESITGAYLSGKLSVGIPLLRRPPQGWISIKGARENNLKNIDVDIPLGVFTCITGVSGSGKSSLITEILSKRLQRDLNRARTVIPGNHDDIKGLDQLDKVINIDQSPIGKTPRSNPATYTGVFDLIRDLFASTPDAKVKGYDKGRFSFNVKGGRCEACGGDGIIKIEMNFLPDVYVPCEVCHGMRYNRETLDVRYKGKNIFEVLDMTIEEATTFFSNVPSISKKISTLNEVGLGYLKLGHPSTSLSGGEAQRVKLATELARRSTGKTIYILDEPTTGLHFADVHKLIDILHKLADGGNSVIVIEHNLDMIKCADYIIDLGPEGGDKGGEVLVQGTPEEVAECEKSYTGQFLKPLLAHSYGMAKSSGKKNRGEKSSAKKTGKQKGGKKDE